MAHTVPQRRLESFDLKTHLLPIPGCIRSRAVLPTWTPIVLSNERMSAPLPGRILALDWPCTVHRHRHRLEANLSPRKLSSDYILVPRSMAKVNQLCYSLPSRLRIAWVSCWEHTPGLLALCNDQLFDPGSFELLQPWKPSPHQAAPELHNKRREINLNAAFFIVTGPSMHLIGGEDKRL